jgi:[ribosomal protein S5]-alanine N-acetyltransferase
VLFNTTFARKFKTAMQNRIHFMLRPWQKTDASSAAEYATTTICRFMSDAFPGEDVVKWEAFIEYANTNPFAFYKTIDVDGRAVGGVGVLLKDDIMRLNAELGYWIADAYRGQGIMTEVVREMVASVFANFEVTRIYATPFGTNFASQRVLEKAGFSLEAMFDKVILKNGIFIDELVYAIRRTKK